MPPKPMKGAASLPLLPNQFKELATRQNLTANVGGRNSVAPTLGGGTLTEGWQGHGSSQGSPTLSEEQKLKMAYTLYLQEGVRNVLAQKMSKMSAQTIREKFGGTAMEQEVQQILNMKEGMIRQDSYLKLVNSLIESNKLRDIYLTLKEQFSGAAGRTLDGLKKMLEASFNRILIEENDGGPSTGRAGARTTKNIAADPEMEVLIQRAKEYFSILDKNGGDQDASSAGRGISPDNPSFMVYFMDAMTELVKEHEEMSLCKKETADETAALMVSTSSTLSHQALAKKNKNNKSRKH